MRARPWLALVSVLAAGLAFGQARKPSPSPSAAAPPAPAAPPIGLTEAGAAEPGKGKGQAQAGLPPGEEEARAALDASPRHGEWLDVPLPGGGPALRTWAVHPERSGKAPVVIVIHEIFGLSDWVRAVADQLAADGFVALAPDLLSGRGPGGGGTASVASRDDVVALVRELKPDDVDARLDVLREYAARLPGAGGKQATLGFCWGGGRSFAYAAHQPALSAAVVYYGASPAEAAVLGRIKAPVLGLYGGDDERVIATIPAAAAELGRLGRTYETEVYAGAGHGFLRQQSGREGANQAAALKAWPRTLEFLRKYLE